MKKIGVVEAVRKDKKGFMIADVWYSNSFLKEEVNVSKGDKVEFDTNEKGYLMEGTKVLEAGQTTKPTDFRINVDAGNCVQRAVELIIARNPEVKKEELSTLIVDTTKAIVLAFNEAKKELV